jgi:hypothetical protein
MAEDLGGVEGLHGGGGTLDGEELFGGAVVPVDVAVAAA